MPARREDRWATHGSNFELVWECHTDDRVCVPGQNACVLCADLGEDPRDYEGHCCDGLVQNAERTACVEAPPTDACIPDGGICGHTGVTIDCCEGTVCSTETDLCEPAA